VVKPERKTVSNPMWRMKVARTILKHNGATALPAWVVDSFGIRKDFRVGAGKSDKSSRITVVFEKKTYGASITVQTSSRPSPFFRLWFDNDLIVELRKAFLMTYVRSLEEELAKKAEKDDPDADKWSSEEEIPFWEFLDIEYNRSKRTAYLDAHFKQRVEYPRFFREVVESQLTTRIEKEKIQGKKMVITMGDWKPIGQLKSQINVENVIYYLLDDNKKEIYIGMADNLTTRVVPGRREIPGWNHYRFDTMPAEFDPKVRLQIEKMTIRSYASILKNLRNIPTKGISEYKLVNRQISRR
jgi:hypothetical protein